MKIALACEHGTIKFEDPRATVGDADFDDVLASLVVSLKHAAGVELIAADKSDPEEFGFRPLDVPDAGDLRVR